MGLNLVVAVTDDDWFEMLRRRPNLDEVNFWALLEVQWLPDQGSNLGPAD